jgi:hypothetical protein
MLFNQWWRRRPPDGCEKRAASTRKLNIGRRARTTSKKTINADAECYVFD